MGDCPESWRFEDYTPFNLLAHFTWDFAICNQQGVSLICMNTVKQVTGKNKELHKKGQENSFKAKPASQFCIQRSTAWWQTSNLPNQKILWSTNQGCWTELILLNYFNWCTPACLPECEIQSFGVLFLLTESWQASSWISRQSQPVVLKRA